MTEAVAGRERAGRDPVRVRVLGPLEVERGGQLVGPAGMRRRTLVAALALRPGEVVSVAELIDAVWGETAPVSARGLVQTYIAGWRKVFGADVLRTVGAGYCLDLADDDLDLAVARRWAESARSDAVRGDHRAAADSYGRAWGLWRGRALADLTEVPFAATAGDGLDAWRLRVLEDWAASAIEVGRAREVEGPLTVAVADHPMRERLTELLMAVLVQSGRSSDALAAYDRTRERLADELGVDPGAGLAEMHLRVLRDDPALRPSVTPDVRPAAVEPSLDRPTDSFRGRDRELDELAELLRGHRIVTVTGPGGAGKTRLALEVGARLQTSGLEEERRGRVVFVDAVPATDADDLLVRIGLALGLEPGDTGQWRRTLGTDAVVAIIDNLEHLPDARDAIRVLVAATETVSVLATSRIPLHVAGEHRYPLDPLALPDDGAIAPDGSSSPAVQLFVDRARAVAPGFRLDGATDSAVVGICHRLDGLPLALELAAGWVSVLSAPQLLDRLERDPALLDHGVLGRPQHQAGLSATLRWSYGRLDSAEQTVLTHLAVFVGGCDLSSAETVCADAIARPVLPVIRALTEKNLLRSASSTARLSMLETVRAFALEQLAGSGAEDGARDAHAAVFADLAEQVSRFSEGPDGEYWLGRALDDADNLRAAIAWFDRRGRRDDVLQMTTDLAGLWWDCGLVEEGARRLTRALAAIGNQRADAVAMARAVLAWLLADYPALADACGTSAEIEARAAVDISLRADDLPTHAFALQTLGRVQLDTSTTAAVETLKAAVDVSTRCAPGPTRYAQSEPATVAGGAAETIANALLYRDTAAAQQWEAEAMRWGRIQGYPPLIAKGWQVLGAIALVRGDPDAADALLTRAHGGMTDPGAAIYRESTDRWQARVDHALHRWDRALDGYTDLLSTVVGTGRIELETLLRCELSDVHLSRGDLDLAAATLQPAVDAPHRDTPSRVRTFVRQARLARLTGTALPDSPLLDAVADDFEADELTPERIIWFTERIHRATHDGRADDAATMTAHLEQLSRQCGVALPGGVVGLSDQSDRPTRDGRSARPGIQVNDWI